LFVVFLSSTGHNQHLRGRLRLLGFPLVDADAAADALACVFQGLLLIHLWFGFYCPSLCLLIFV
jgi:hypothetical protein